MYANVCKCGRLYVDGSSIEHSCIQSNSKWSNEIFITATEDGFLKDEGLLVGPDAQQWRDI